ncbi:MAG: DHA2 family efflux MFS transporter permease subunit [Hyphomicrobiaceae bacterium]
MLPQDPQRPEEEDRVKRVLPWLVAVAFFMQALDTTILNTAVPTMAEALGVRPLDMKSVLSCYTLSVAVFVPVSGWIADRFGTRRVFATAIALFMLGSLLAGLANSVQGLVFSRILQGFGGAMMVPVGRLTMVRTFPKSELVRAMTFVSMPALVGPMLGPVVGGLIVHYLHWRLIFLVNLPVGLAGLVLIIRNMPDYRSDQVWPLDWRGLLLFSSGLALLSYVLEVFGAHSLPGSTILLLLGVSVALIVGYAYHALGAEHPLLRLNLFRIRTFRTAAVGSFVTRLGASGVPFLLPLLYQSGLGYSPVQSALLILPQFMTALTVKALIPKILARLGYRGVLTTNTIAVGLLIASFSTIHSGTAVPIILLQASLFGFCQSLQFSSMNTLVYADIRERDASMASTMASTLQQMSMSFGVATASLLAAWLVPVNTGIASAELVAGIHKAFLVLGALTVVSTLVFRGLRKDDGASVSLKGEVAEVRDKKLPPDT